MEIFQNCGEKIIPHSERVMPCPLNFFSVDFYDLKTFSFNLSIDVFISFEMPSSFYQMIVGKLTSHCRNTVVEYQMHRLIMLLTDAFDIQLLYSHC